MIRVGAGAVQKQIEDAIDRACAPDGDGRVVLASGVYELARPIRLGSRHSGLTLAGEGRAELTGGVTAQPVEFVRDNGRRVWQFSDASLPLRSLSVNRALRPASRYPQTGTIPLREVLGIPPRLDERQVWQEFFAGQDEVVVDPGLIQSLDLARAELVVAHYWVQERLPIVTADFDTGRLILGRKSAIALWDDHEGLADCWIDFIVAPTPDPGHWSHDPASGTVYYAPLAEETLSNSLIRMAQTDSLLEIGEDTGVEGAVTDVSIENLVLSSAGGELPPVRGELAEELYWGYPEVGPYPGPDVGASLQAAVHVRGAIRVRNSERIALRMMTIESCEGYGIEVGPGSHHITICELSARQLGAGAVIATGSRLAEGRDGRVSEVSISQCRVRDTGRIYLDAVGILVGHVDGCVVANNELGSLPYSAISAGFTWDEVPTGTHGLLVEGNRIDTIGSGILSDLGGIYLVGSITGGIVRGNSIVGVRRRRYGAWGIYLDEGTNDLLIENNVVADCEAQSFHHHFGKNNTLRENVFIGGPEGVIRCSRVNSDVSMTITRNVLVAEGGPVYVGGQAVADGGAGSLADTKFVSDGNAILRKSSSQSMAGNGRFLGETWVWIDEISLDDWRSAGHDELSTVLTDSQSTEHAIQEGVLLVGLQDHQSLLNSVAWTLATRARIAERH